MFSKELYELDKNTVQYMIDEQQEKIDEQREKIDEQREKIDKMQEKIDKQQQEIGEMQEKHIKETDEIQKQGIRNAVTVLQDLKLSEQEIVIRICDQYQISEEQMWEFL